MNFVQNILWNSVEGFVEAGTRTAGGYAGDALIKAGDLIENSGRGFGSTIERAATGYGGKISGQSYEASGKALPSTARRPVAKRSNSSPASSKPTSKTPLGANKYPGGKSTGAAQKQITNGAKSTAGGAGKSLGAAQKKAGSVVGGGTVSAKKTAGGLVGSGAKALPKPFPQNSNGTSKSSSYETSFPTQKKAAVRPGGPPKPFKAPEADKAKSSNDGGKKPYPGTSTLPGQGSKVPVQAQKYKPLPRMQGTAEKGKVEHFSGFGVGKQDTAQKGNGGMEHIGGFGVKT